MDFDETGFIDVYGHLDEYFERIWEEKDLGDSPFQTISALRIRKQLENALRLQQLQSAFKVLDKVRIGGLIREAIKNRGGLLYDNLKGVYDKHWANNYTIREIQLLRN